MPDIFSYLMENIFRIMPAAASVFNDAFGNTLSKISNGGGSGYLDVQASYLPTYIGTLLGWTVFMGVTIILQVIVAAYEYMTAQGEEEKVIKAKQRIRNVIISCFILVGGYALATAVVILWSQYTGYRGIGN